MPTMVRVVERKERLEFLCGDCGAQVLDLRGGCQQCGVKLVGLLVEKSAEAWMTKMGGSPRQVLWEGHGLIHTPLDLEWLFSVRRG